MLVEVGDEAIPELVVYCAALGKINVQGTQVITPFPAMQADETLIKVLDRDKKGAVRLWFDF